MTEYATGPVQEDGFYRYSFRADNSGDPRRAEVVIEAVDPESAERLAAEAARAEQATGAVIGGTGGPFPRSLAEYVPTGHPGHRAPAALVLRVPRGKGGIFYLEPAIQEAPGLLPVPPRAIRKIAVNVYEALTVLHRVGYAHGAVNTSSLLWNQREAVLARYHRASRDPDGRQRSTDVADAARLLYHVATGRPLNGDLSHSARRDLNSRLSGLGDLLAAALEPQDRRINAFEALERAGHLVLPRTGDSGTAPVPQRQDTAEEAEARRKFRSLRAKHEDIRRRRYPPPPREPSLPSIPDELPPRSPWRVMWDEGAARAARHLLGRLDRWDTTTRWFAIGAVAVATTVLGVLLGRML
ncbi:hypothetical protein FOF52_10290 [Thermobifida alba]|uniref:Protein kinase domain-containing protein n=1 Tax=Thermobifida alba TaxID=53522 RepID=A0ABY4L5F1_THEAE|nr:hypothetical protein [Thermobifida alba]UPT21302.1 hypothetical protein FOF52_10290 [Thermobifida alba]